MKHFRTLLFSLFWVGLLLPLAADAQQGSSYPVRRPAATCSKAVFGSDLTVRLTGLPSGALVWCSLDILNPGELNDPGLSEDTLPEPSSFDFLNGVADAQGNFSFSIPLNNPDWQGQSFALQALVKNQEDAFLLPLRFKIESPGLYLASLSNVSGGLISRFDEIAGRVTGEIGNLEGAPRKLIFTADGRKGIILLDGGRIAVFDDQSMRVERLFPAGQELVDLAVTPDGRKLCVLVAGLENPVFHHRQRARLVIFDADTFTLLQSTLIDCVNPLAMEAYAGGGLLAVTEDSTGIYVGQAEMLVGFYNFLTDQFQRFHLADAHCTRGEIREIRVCGRNGLVVLVEQPDREAFLFTINTQTLRKESISLGTDCLGIKLLQSEGRPPRVVALDRIGPEADRLRLIDLFQDWEPQQVNLPPGAIDFDITDTLNLCLILYPDSLDETGSLESLGRRLCLVDLDDPTLERRNLSLEFEGLETGDSALELGNMGGGDWVYLSRSPLLRLGYLFSREGILTVIDLDRFSVLSRNRVVDGSGTARLVESY